MDTVFERMCAECGLDPLNGDGLEFEDQEELVRCIWQVNQLNADHAKIRAPGFEVEVGFFKSSQRRAFSGIFEGTDVIAVSWGIIETYRGVFSGIMGLSVFSWIPQHQRDEAALWLYECAKHSIFLHELGHIWNGHTSLKQQRGIASSRDGGLSNIDLQTLEFDADSFAATHIFNFGVITHPFPIIKSELDDQFGRGATYLLMTVFAIYMVFRLEDRPADFDPDEKKLYPSTPLRQRMMAGVLVAHAGKKGLFEEQNAWDLVVQGIWTAEEVFAKWMKRPRSDTAVRAALSAEGGKYQDKLLQHWHAIRPQLDPLKRGGELPKAQYVDDESIWAT
ncbi:hypothetical protein [Rhizobium tubonense]|uniref:Uncharacterized protein n=1 Tax=Rhizobium tubonense TaxID=484088 RepID=A0A2W4D3L7_9HYPH|nr:hypothetical protein [Rhizobium tubonense]PZM12074.1 hypothetical protein CPY51_18390 [Rhizobium tubonense]